MESFIQGESAIVLKNRVVANNVNNDSEFDNRPKSVFSIAVVFND